MSTPFDKLFTGRGIGILIGFFIFVGFFILFNKAWCGYVCPLGTIQDWITKIRTKTGIRYSAYSAPTFNKLKTIKYLLLVLLILIPMGIGNSIAGLPKLSHDFGVPFCMICPGRTVLPLFNGDFSQVAVDFSSIPKMVLSSLGLLLPGSFFRGIYQKALFLPVLPNERFALHFLQGELVKAHQER